MAEPEYYQQFWNLSKTKQKEM